MLSTSPKRLMSFCLYQPKMAHVSCPFTSPRWLMSLLFYQPLVAHVFQFVSALCGTFPICLSLCVFVCVLVIAFMAHMFFFQSD